MKIYGMQKLTLLDYPGKIAVTLFTGGCNFRCPFCHNAGLVLHLDAAEPMGEDEVFAFLEKRRGVLEGVCVTGGEPLLQADIAEFLAKIKAMGYAVKLDTNGSFPGRLRRLLDAGLLDYVAMDIKNSPERYALTAGLSHINIGDIMESVRILMDSPLPYEFRTTVVRELHGERDFKEIGRWLAGAKQYVLQPFRDAEQVIAPGFHAPAEAEMDAYLAIVQRTIPNAARRG